MKQRARTGKRMLHCRLAGLLGLALLVGVPAHAQRSRAALPDSPAGSESSASALSLEPGFLAEEMSQKANRVSDMVLGHDVKGPYTLSRRRLMPGSETVYVDGARAFRMTDYQIDYTAGTVVFQFPLATGHAARVDYAIDPKTSAPNLRPLSAPLSLDLAELQLGALMKSTLQFNGVWSTPAQGQPVLTAIGMGLSTNLGAKTHVSSVFAMTPRSSLPDGTPGSTDTSGMQIQADTNIQGVQARVNYLRTGQAFAAAKEYKWKPGTEVLDLSTAYAFNHNLSARSSYQESNQVGPDGKPVSSTTTISHEMVASLLAGAQITLGHSARQTDNANQPDQSMSTDRVQLDQKLGQFGSAQVRHEIVTQGTGNNTQTTTATTGLKLDAKVTGGTRITAQHVEAHSDVQDSSTTGVKLDTQVTGGTHLTAEHVEARTNSQDPTLNTQVGLTTGVGKVLKVQGQYSLRDNPNSAPEEVASARVEATPVGGLKIGGGILQRQNGTGEQTQTDARVELNTYGGLNVVGTMNSQEDASGHPVSIVRAVDARLKPIQAFEVSGTYKMRDQRDQDGPITQGLKLSIAPVRFLQLQGSVVENPEENGQVTAEQRRTIGLKSDLGPVSLAGSYAQRLTLTQDPLAQDLEVTLGLQLSKYDRLFSAYKVSEETNGALQSSHYRFGYTRSIGNTFGLSLEGEYLQYMQNGAIMTDKSEARAKAGLNAKF